MVSSKPSIKRLSLHVVPRCQTGARCRDGWGAAAGLADAVVPPAANRALGAPLAPLRGGSVGEGKGEGDDGAEHERWQHHDRHFQQCLAVDPAPILVVILVPIHDIFRL
jgi:hypothetical protein